jgi:hypothetical protein
VTAENSEKVIQEQKAWIANLEQGNAWLEQQVRNWQVTAENSEKVIQEQKNRVSPFRKSEKE